MRGSWSFVFVLYLYLLFSLGGCSSNSGNCKEDSTCGDAMVCKAGECVKKESPKTGCSEDNECQKGEVCKDGRCGPKPGCSDDSECKKEEVCQDSRCRPKETGCRDHSECKAGEHCENGACVKVECSTDTDCLGKTKPYCSNVKKCEWECKEDSHCSTEKVCKENRCILKQTGCKSDVDCVGKARKYCSDDGLCEWSCKQDYECKQSERCDAKQRVCVRRSPSSCEQNSDCESTELCWNNHCWKRCDPEKQPGNCQSNQSCLKVTQAGKLAGACMQKCDVKQKTCPTGFLCAARHPCSEPIEQCHGGHFQLLPSPHCLPEYLGLVVGKKEHGESCTSHAFEQGVQSPKPDQACNGHKKLFCMMDVCRQICFPGQGDTCPKGYTCSDDVIVTTVGVCLKEALQKQGEPCDELDKRCLSGLKCQRGICQSTAKDKERIDWPGLPSIS